MSVAACPACTAALPAAKDSAARAAVPTHHLVLPHIHCAGCIRTVERVLGDQPGIEAARVNLSLRRAAITAEPGADPTPWIAALARAGYEAHEARDAAPGDDRGRALIIRLGVAGFAMMNVMLLSVAIWSGATDATRELFHWISAMIALPATIYAAQPFFVSAWSALSVRRLNMDVPISLAILLASGMSLYETWAGGAHAYFDAALSLTFFLLAGRVLDQRMRKATRSAAQDLARLEPSRAMRITGKARESVAVADLAVGDMLWLAAGARLPVDAVLLADGASVDASVITGESDPVARHKGGPLRAGEVVLTGPVTARVTAVGEDTTLRRMARLVAVAENARSRYTGLADRAAAIYAPAVHLIAFAAFVGWAALTGDVRHALNVAVATLIITCPCALGLAVPAVATAATGQLYRLGLLVKSETALERLAEVDCVVFDKTGTLTRSQPVPPETISPADRSVLAALANASDHPVSAAISAILSNVTPAALTRIEEHPGKGVEALWDVTEVRLGSGKWLGSDAETALQIGTRIVPIERREVLMPDAADAVRDLKNMGLAVHILTGDTEAKARAVAQRLATEPVMAGVSPEDKQAYVANLQAQGRKVLMVGDGLNDTAALTSANASIAPGRALEASRNAADVVLVAGQLTGIGTALRVSRSARRRIIENFGLAASYNAVAIPIALAGFATPLLAALAMSASSITVIVNALRVRRTS